MPDLGSTFKIEVETAPAAGTYVTVADMDTFDSNRSNSQTEHSVFQRVLAYVILGAQTDAFTIGGLLTSADAGQLLLIGAFNSKAAIKVKITADGTSGYTQSVKVLSQRRTVRPDGFAGISWEMRGDATPVTVSAGPLI